MNNWKTIATAAVSTPAAVVANPQRELHIELVRALNDGKIAESSRDFALSVAGGYVKYGSWTERQVEAVKSLLARISAPIVASPDKLLAEALRLGLERNFIAARDIGFATSLLAGYGKYGSFTDKQRPHVERLVKGSDVAEEPKASKPVDRLFPNICATVSLDKFSTFTVGELRLSLKNDGSAIWVKLAGMLAGRIDTGTTAYAPIYRDRADQHQTMVQLLAVEADPKAAAAKDGILTGRCSCCGRPLTDPSSIAIGIGPICAAKF